MTISYKQDSIAFMQRFMMHGRPLNCSMDFIGNLTNALEKGKSVEFLDNMWEHSTGVLNDICISECDSSSGSTFYLDISYTENNGTQHKLTTPPFHDDTVEYHDNIFDRYYLYSPVKIGNDHRCRITILNN